MCVDLPPWSSAMSIEHPTHSTRTSLPERRNKWAAAGAGAAVGLLGGMIGLGGAEFRLPLLIGLFGFLALEAVILNKVDMPEAKELAEFVKPEFEKLGLNVYVISTASHEGLKELNWALAAMVSDMRKEVAEREQAEGREQVGDVCVENRRPGLVVTGADRSQWR